MIARFLDRPAEHRATIEFHETIAGLQSREFVVLKDGKSHVVRSLDVKCELRGPIAESEVEDLYFQGLVYKVWKRVKKVDLLLPVEEEVRSSIVFGRGFAVEMGG